MSLDKNWTSWYWCTKRRDFRVNAPMRVTSGHFRSIRVISGQFGSICLTRIYPSDSNWPGISIRYSYTLIRKDSKGSRPLGAVGHFGAIQVISGQFRKHRPDLNWPGTYRSDQINVGYIVYTHQTSVFCVRFFSALLQKKVEMSWFSEKSPKNRHI